MATRLLALRPSGLISQLTHPAHTTASAKRPLVASSDVTNYSTPLKVKGLPQEKVSSFNSRSSASNQSKLPNPSHLVLKPMIRQRAHTTQAVATAVAAKLEGAVEDIQKRTLIKVCGVTSAEDAAIAAKAGADLIGMIMWPGSKRYVTVEQAAQISAAAKAHGAQPVAVFVDETAADISDACAAADISIAQLHGDVARGALGELPGHLKVVYVLHAESDGTIRTLLPRGLSDADTGAGTAGDSGPSVKTPVPKESAAAALEPRSESDRSAEVSGVGPSSASRDRSRSKEESEMTGASECENAQSSDSPVDKSEATVVEWLLVDGVSAGSGETYDWTTLRLPQGLSERGWLLAGGLDPTNVAAALGAASPDGVDVASGVAGLDKIRKDRAKVEAFICAVKTATEGAAAGAL